MSDPIKCPNCDLTSWKQQQHYSATDNHWLDWNPVEKKYVFTFEQVSTSDEDTDPWFCLTCNAKAPDELQELLDEAINP